MPPKNAVPLELLGSMLAGSTASININITQTTVNQSSSTQVAGGGGTSKRQSAPPRARQTNVARKNAPAPPAVTFDGLAAETKPSIGKAPRAKQTAKKSARVSSDPYPRDVFTTDASQTARPPRPKAPKATQAEILPFPPQTSNAPSPSKPKPAKSKPVAKKNASAAPSTSKPAKSGTQTKTSTTTKATKSTQSFSFEQTQTTTSSSSRGGRAPGAPRAKQTARKA